MSTKDNKSVTKPVVAAPVVVEGMQPASPVEKRRELTVEEVYAAVTRLSQKDQTKIVKSLAADRRAAVLKAKSEGLQVGQKVTVNDARSPFNGKAATVVKSGLKYVSIQFEPYTQPRSVKVSSLQKA